MRRAIGGQKKRNGVRIRKVLPKTGSYGRVINNARIRCVNKGELGIEIKNQSMAISIINERTEAGLRDEGACESEMWLPGAHGDMVHAD